MQLAKLEELSSSMRLAAEDWDQPWKTLLSTMMSARTRDEKTIPIATELFRKYGTLDSLAKADLRSIQKIIRPINFYITKSKNVRNCARILVEKYNGIIPHDFEKLIELPGVGRKTANVFLSEMGNDAIGIDTHVAYISRKLGWTDNKNPKKVEDDLKRIFPQNYWRKINHILVRFGKTHTSKMKKDELLRKIRDM